MTVYSPAQIAKIWQRNGGSMQHWIDATAVSLAESGGNSDAISPSRDYGLWQINASNFARFGVDDASVLNIDNNARIAISMSGNGTNWAAWCTCWVNPGPNCGHGYLPHPQPGSPADRQMARAAAALGGVPLPDVKPESGSNTHATIGAWNELGVLVGTYARHQHDHAAGMVRRVRGIS